MKQPPGQSICQIRVIDEDDPNPRKFSNYDKTSLIFLSLTLLLATGTVSVILYQTLLYNSETHLSSNEFRKIVKEIFLESNELLKNGGGLGEVQVLDKNRNLLWFKTISEETLKDKVNEIADEFKELNGLRESTTRNKRSVVSSSTREYVVSHQMKFVNCDHFKPIQRGKYLVPPSLHSLHTCYQYGVTRSELDRGILRRQGAGEFRYNLQDLYVACHDVFNDQVDELTNELRNDYERCKWSGALDENQQRVVEERFAPNFVPPKVPENLEASSSPYPSTTSRSDATTTTTATRVDPRAFVQCSHVETELYEDSLESPSPEALQRCQKFGVTYDELRQGYSTRNPPAEQARSNVADLYVPCHYVFDGKFDYLTNELKEDYRRCKRMRALNRTTLAKVESKFYEQLYDERDLESRRPQCPTTPATTTTTSDDNFEQRPTTTAAYVPPAFPNCKRVENKDYYICVKVITSFNGPVINV